MGKDLKFDSEFVGVSGITVTTDYGPTPVEEFFQDPTSYVLMGILALLAVGIVLHLRRKSS